MKIFYSFFLVVVSFSFLFSGCTKKRVLTKEEIKIKRSELFKKCNALDCVNINKGIEFEKYIENFLNLKSNEISDSQKQDFKIKFIEMFLAFSQGREDAYKSYITPTNLNWFLTPDALMQIRKRWDLNKGTNNIIPSNEKLFAWYLKEISGGNFYKDFWIAVCLDPLPILSKSEDNKHLSLKPGVNFHKDFMISAYELDASDIIIELYKNTYWNASFIKKHFEEENNILETYRKNDFLLLADVFCFIKRTPPAPPFILITQFYWNEFGQTWISRGYIVGYIPGVDDYQNYNIVEVF